MDNMRWLCLDRMNNLFSFIQILRTYTKGGLWALEEVTCDASESEAARTWIQMESAPCSVKSMLHLDPSTSSLVFSSRKCDTAVANGEWDPQQTLLAATASIRPSSSSTAMDI
jgi:hypothetical protein